MVARRHAAERAKVRRVGDRGRHEGVARSVTRHGAAARGNEVSIEHRGAKSRGGHAPEARRLVRLGSLLGVEQAHVEEPAARKLVEDLRARNEAAQWKCVSMRKEMHRGQ